MNILITGVAGLLGNNFARYLKSKGIYKIIGIDDFSGGFKEFLPECDIFYEFDLKDQSKVKEIFRSQKIDIVFHFAAYAAEGLSPFIRKYNYENNVISSINLINECITYDIKFIFMSSMAVYGNQLPPFNESMIPSPIDPYGIAKYAVEMDIKTASDQFGLKYNIVRPHNVVGIYQNIWDRYRNVIGIFIRKTLNGDPISVFGDGNQTRAFSDVKYYMDPFEKLIYGYDNEIINIGADKYFSINEIANKVMSISNSFGYNPTIVHLEERHEAKHAYCDHSKALDLLSFKDETNIDLLIEEMFVWYMSKNPKKIKNMEYEINKGIYSYWA